MSVNYIDVVITVEMQGLPVTVRLPELNVCLIFIPDGRSLKP